MSLMATSTATELGKDIDTALGLSDKAVEDPDAAQQLTGLIKDLLNYKACTQASKMAYIADKNTSDDHEMLPIHYTNVILHVGYNRHSGLHPSRQEAQEAHKAQQHSCSASSCSNSSLMEGVSDPRSGRAEWICRCCSFSRPAQAFHS